MGLQAALEALEAAGASVRGGAAAMAALATEAAAWLGQLPQTLRVEVGAYPESKTRYSRHLPKSCLLLLRP